PQHQHWYEDLPARDAPIDRAPGMVHGDVNTMDEACLEVSRASTLMRGGAALFGSLGIGFIVFFLVFFGRIFFPLEQGLLVPFITSIFGFAFLVCMVILFFRTDFSIPRDRPIRFNRSRRKVYVYEYAYTWNPFIKWPATIKEFDWDTLQAEI